MPRIIHVTSVHNRYDIRIFAKECISLSKVGYEVFLIVADGNGDERKCNVEIVDIGKAESRLARFLYTLPKVFKKAEELNGDVYHLHDPELIPLGLKLKSNGKKVIFDSHEDLPSQILSKTYLPFIVRILLSYAAKVYEFWACEQLDGIVAATPHIRNKFLKMNDRVIDINNYPLDGELSSRVDENKVSTNSFCYVGSISQARGILELVEALALMKHKSILLLAGTIEEEGLREKLSQMKGWAYVSELGNLDRAGVKDVLNRSSAGLVTLRPTISYLDALPVKMFEYMSAGVAVIASSFPLWQKIIRDNECGLCVNPLEPQEIADAMDFIIENPNIAERMGAKGIEAVKNHYSWSNESDKLVSFYDKLLS